VRDALQSFLSRMQHLWKVEQLEHLVFGDCHST
jgi:hypothetical protein